MFNCVKGVERASSFTESQRIVLVYHRTMVSVVGERDAKLEARIYGIRSVRYREVVRSWEGPLWEVPLYSPKNVISVQVGSEVTHTWSPMKT